MLKLDLSDTKRVSRYVSPSSRVRASCRRR